jgi:CENP-B-like protein
VNDMISEVQLPDLGKRSDRKLGWCLWRCLRGRDLVPAPDVRRVKNALGWMSRNPDLTRRYAAISQVQPARGRVNATLETAFRLAAAKDFVAAGAVYRVVYPRLQKRFDEIDTRHERQMNVAKARGRKEYLAIEKAVKVHRLIAKISREYIEKLETDKRFTKNSPAPEYVSRHRQEISSEAIGRRLKIPASTVRRILKSKKT